MNQYLKYILLIILGIILFTLINNKENFSIGGAYIYTTTDEGREIFLPAKGSEDNPENFSDKYPDLYEGIDIKNIIVYKGQEIESGKSYFFPDDQGNEILFAKEREGNYYIDNNGEKKTEIYKIFDHTYLFNGIIDLIKHRHMNLPLEYSRLKDRMDGILLLRTIVPTEFKWSLGYMRIVDIEAYGKGPPDIRLLINVYFNELKNERGEMLTLFMFTNLRRNEEFYFSPGILMAYVNPKDMNDMNTWFIKTGYNIGNIYESIFAGGEIYNYLRFDNLGIPILQTIAQYLTDNYMDLFGFTKEMFIDASDIVTDRLRGEVYRVFPHFEERLIRQRTEEPFIPKTLGPFTIDNYLYIKLGTFKTNISDQYEGDNVNIIITKKSESDDIMLVFDTTEIINFKDIESIIQQEETFEIEEFDGTFAEGKPIIIKKIFTYIIFNIAVKGLGLIRFGYQKGNKHISYTIAFNILEDIHKYVKASTPTPSPLAAATPEPAPSPTPTPTPSPFAAKPVPTQAPLADSPTPAPVIKDINSCEDIIDEDVCIGDDHDYECKCEDGKWKDGKLEDGKCITDYDY